MEEETEKIDRSRRLRVKKITEIVLLNVKCILSKSDRRYRFVFK